jgi:hypothetical protein
MSLLINTNSKSSGELTASTQVTTVSCTVFAVVLNPGSTASTIYLRNGASGGTLFWRLDGAANSSSICISFPNGLKFSDKLYATLTGTGVTAYVLYV